MTTNLRPILKNKYYLYLTEFFTGVSVMAVELGASRLLAPYFSSSQIVWTIIIGTIMIAMALGNLWGGRTADKDPNTDRLYRRILVAAVWIAAIPVVGKYIILGISGLLVLTINTNFLIVAAFCTCMVLFVFPLFLLGTVTPFCSCSSIPLFIGFTTAGLPLGVTFSFLISSPMVDLGSLVLLMSIFGTKVAIFYVVVGLALAVAGGTLLERLHMEKHVEQFVFSAGSIDIESPELTRRERVRYAREQAVSTFKKVAPYILVGVGLGAVIHNWIPESWIETVLGGSNPFGVVLAVLVGVPMYADIFGTIPVAEALLAKGAQLGTVLTFMMAVTTLSLPSMIMLRKAVKPRLLGLFIAICTSGIILIGYLFNVFQFYLISI